MAAAARITTRKTADGQFPFVSCGRSESGVSSDCSTKLAPLILHETNDESRRFPHAVHRIFCAAAAGRAGLKAGLYDERLRRTMSAAAARVNLGSNHLGAGTSRR